MSPSPAATQPLPSRGLSPHCSLPPQGQDEDPAGSAGTSLGDKGPAEQPAWHSSPLNKPPSHSEAITGGHHPWLGGHATARPWGQRSAPLCKADRAGENTRETKWQLSQRARRGATQRTLSRQRGWGGGQPGAASPPRRDQPLQARRGQDPPWVQRELQRDAEPPMVVPGPPRQHLPAASQGVTGPMGAGRWGRTWGGSCAPAAITPRHPPPGDATRHGGGGAAGHHDNWHRDARRPRQCHLSLTSSITRRPGNGGVTAQTQGDPPIPPGPG